mmetsp:Transcript_667/g.1897  ORF Transcript_667/g.1897 Transcript_667/m.1897 type:complete len:278 (-) Transcript_667:1016-1849(-)
MASPLDDIGDGAPMDETPSNTSLLSFDLGSGLTPKMSWLASRTRDGLGPSALQRQGSGGESLGSLPSRDLLANLTDPISPSVAPYLQSLMSPREASALPAQPSRPPTTQEAEALENWAKLAQRPFSGGALANSSARLFARRLSEAVQRHMAGSDGTPIGHLGQQGHALIERAVHWPARTLRGVIRLLECLDRSPEASFAQFLCLMGDLEMTSRPSITPPVEKRSRPRPLSRAVDATRPEAAATPCIVHAGPPVSSGKSRRSRRRRSRTPRARFMTDS